MCFILDRIQWWVDVAECQLVSWQRLLSPGSGMWSAADSGSAAKCPGDDTQLPLLSSRRKLIDSCLRSKRGFFFSLSESAEKDVIPLKPSTVLSRHDQGQGVTKRRWYSCQNITHFYVERSGLFNICLEEKWRVCVFLPSHQQIKTWSCLERCSDSRCCTSPPRWCLHELCTWRHIRDGGRPGADAKPGAFRRALGCVCENK